MQQFHKFITWRFVSLNMFRAPPLLYLQAGNWQLMRSRLDRYSLVLSSGSNRCCTPGI